MKYFQVELICTITFNIGQGRFGCWSDEVEVPVLVSAQMVTVRVKYKGSGDTFLSSFVYHQTVQWREGNYGVRLSYGDTV